RYVFFFQAEDGIRDRNVTGVQTCALPISCYAFALLFGFVWTFLRRVPNRFIAWIVTWTMEFIRSTPPLVQLYFLFYSLPLIPYKIGRASCRERVYISSVGRS